MLLYPASTPIASVALCTCNGDRFLRQQLDSIHSQSRAVDEIIICDDASEDRTPEIVLQFAAETRVPVKWFRNPSRLGVTRNFERAISLCKGRFIFLCDQDDIWAPNKVAVLLETMESSTAAMAFSNAQVVDDQRRPRGYRLWDSIWFNPAEQRRMKSGDALPVLLRHAVAAGTTLVFRSEYLPLILPIPDLPHCHDIWITQLLAAVGTIIPVDQDLIQYRLHGGNQVGMRQNGLIDQLRMARHQIKTNTFDFLTKLNQAALDRLGAQSTWAVNPPALQLLRAKIDHSIRRHDLPSNRLARLSVILRELTFGNYGRYSYGFKSVLQDLFLR